MGSALREERLHYWAGGPGCEFRVSDAGLSERDLARLWEGQRFPRRALATTRGQRLRVLHRGLPGRGPGPDFRDAVIQAPWGVLRGDVELHLRAGDFRRHGHHRDPAYDGLALHLVCWPDGDDETLLACGRRVPVAALAPWLERRSGEIRGWLERPALWEEPCRDAGERMGSEAMAATLDRLGEIRFRRRRRELRRALDRGRQRDGRDDVLYGAVLEALGYGGNREAFRLLALRLPWRALRAALLAASAERRAASALEALRTAAEAPPPLAWRTSGLRPANHPRRRLEAAAHLLARYAHNGPARGMESLPDGEAAAAVEALTVRKDGRTLLGAGRAIELLTNAVLPFLAAEGELAPALALYRALPRPAEYGSVRHLDRALRPAVKVDARRQQGMLFLLNGYCRRGRCGSCPLS